MSDAELKHHILLRLIYGEVFRHPLTLEEIETLIPPTTANVQAALHELVDCGLLQEKDSYYFILEEGDKIHRRDQGALQAERLMPKAWKVGRKIYRFPYVEGVAISGSLSKKVLHEDSDFDFFIITKPNRLWVARTLLILYKKIFLLNSRKHFCVNYFIDTDHLEIEDQNVFTATEMATLMPVAGDILATLFERNDWVETYSQNPMRTPYFPLLKKPLPSRFLMWLMKGRFGEWVDERCLRFTLKRWKNKFTDFDPNTFELTMRSRRYISKHHPHNFQQKVLQRREEIRAQFKERYVQELEQAGIRL